MADGVDGRDEDIEEGEGRRRAVVSTQLRLPMYPRKRRRIDDVVENDAHDWDLRIEIADETVESTENAIRGSRPTR